MVVAENALARANDEAHEVALLKAVGWDRLSAPQRDLALGIARNYELDPMLRHLVLIEGKPYITRDGLLHVAHRSGQLDGIETTEPQLVDGYWRSTCSVYRKDMGRPFTYTGRYPEKGGNAKFAPEMAVKVGEVMALRRAFDVAAPTAEERWDADVSVSAEAPERPSLAERVAARRAEIEPPQLPEATPLPSEAPEPSETPTEDEGRPHLSEAAFKAWLVAARIPIPKAQEVRLSLFPDAGLALDDYQRAELQAALEPLAI